MTSFTYYINAGIFPPTTVASPAYTTGSGIITVQSIGSISIPGGKFVTLSVFRSGVLLGHWTATGISGSTFTGVVVASGYTDVNMEDGDAIEINVIAEDLNLKSTSINALETLEAT